jgi:carbamoyltransferase
MSQYILGMSAYYHDSAAVLLEGEKIVAAAQEERFTRKKHDPEFPHNAIQYCLDEAGITLSDLAHIVFYDKPFLKFERLLETYIAFAPKGFFSFAKAMPIWIKEKLFLKSLLRRSLGQMSGLAKSRLPPLLFSEHHLSHAASAFYPSPFEEAAVLCLDGVGEWATTSAWLGKNNSLDLLWEIDFPHSLGLLYSAFTYYIGFRVNSGEYKLMGLAPYGEPRYENRIREHLIDVKEDGSFHLNMEYFDFATGLRMTNRRFARLFGGPPRKPDSAPNQKDMDLARSVQAVTEDIVLRLAKSIHTETGSSNLCLAGGVALNCVANGRVLREGPFRNLWVQPAAGDAGGALGAAMEISYRYLKIPRENRQEDKMQGAYLGPKYTNKNVRRILDDLGAVYQVFDDNELLPMVAQLIADGNVIGWFQGRMEFGPRALGSRSILADPRSQTMQKELNLKIKKRESFRPFAPSVLDRAVTRYFELETDSPYMGLVTKLAADQLLNVEEGLGGLAKLQQVRSRLPATTHVDNTARIQTVHKSTNPRYYRLIEAFEQITGIPVLINTSFNVRGEPIVASPEDAYRCFLGTGMDYLVIENCLLENRKQPTERIPQTDEYVFDPD